LFVYPKFEIIFAALLGDALSHVSLVRFLEAPQ